VFVSVRIGKLKFLFIGPKPCSHGFVEQRTTFEADTFTDESAEIGKAYSLNTAHFTFHSNFMVLEARLPLFWSRVHYKHCHAGEWN
jgi:hypothetical protein